MRTYRSGSIPLLALALAFCGAAALTPPASAQPVKARTYATEQLRELSVTDQRRVIADEYREQSRGRTIPEDQMRFYLDQVRLSDWTFSRIKRDIAESLARGDGGTPGTGDVIRCESESGRQQSCTTPWSTTSRLVRQLSNTPCTEGATWSSSPGRVWVSSGCRAEFAAGWNDNGGNGNTIRCESSDNRQKTCPTPWNALSRLVRQLSSTPCVEGRNWSSTHGQVWVNGGCRAEFAPGLGNGNGNAQEIRCESSDGRYRQCGTGLYGRARLVRQLSDTACREGTNWGLRGGSLWVDGGCRGVFTVDAGGWNDNTGQSVVCASENGRFTTCPWDRNLGIPRLLDTLSNTACTQGYSWGYTRRGGLWVNHGCRGRFGVR